MTAITTATEIDEPFATRLRTHTQEAHTRAESAGFMNDLMGGAGTTEDYVALLGQYYFIYDALERSGERFRADSVARAFVDDALLRGDALAADLQFFLGDGWRERLTALPSTSAYVAALDALPARGSAHFVAHHYLRYLGDLSGGQIIRVMVQRHYGIPDEGLSFLKFPLVAKPKTYKDAYRVALNEAAWTPEDRDGFISEVDYAYGLNYELFTELGEARAPK
jgi:heme oxygenase